MNKTTVALLLMNAAMLSMEQPSQPRRFLLRFSVLDIDTRAAAAASQPNRPEPVQDANADEPEVKVTPWQWGCEPSEEMVAHYLQQKYDKPFAVSPAVALHFKAHEDNVRVWTKKRLCFHLFAQAAKDSNFKVNDFAKLIEDIKRQEDDEHGRGIQTMHAAAFRRLLHYIPWDGKTDHECGVTFHEVLLNTKFANLGIDSFQAEHTCAPHMVSIFANNEDDFDSEIDHRKMVEKKFDELVALARVAKEKEVAEFLEKHTLPTQQAEPSSKLFPSAE